MNILSILMGLFIGLIGVLVFFLLIREIVVWYLKINQIKKLLEKIEENTRKRDAICQENKKYFPKKIEE